MIDSHQSPNIETAERIALGHLKRALFDAGMAALEAYRELDTKPQHFKYPDLGKYFADTAQEVTQHCAWLSAYDHVRRPPPALPPPVVEPPLPERLAQAVQSREDFQQQRTVRRGVSLPVRDGWGDGAP